jgi:hypothetical protein
MVNRTVVVGLGLVILAGCSSTPDASDPSTSPSVSIGPTVAPGGNGTFYSSQWDTAAGTLTIMSHPIGADGSIGSAVELLTAPADDTSFPAVIDGVGGSTLTGSFTDYWTTDVQVRSAGAVSAEAAAPRWCGGEGLSYNVCTLLDPTRVVRTTELGRDPTTGEGPGEGSILVSSLADASTISEFGPVADLVFMLGTGAPDEVLVVTSPAQSADAPTVPSAVMRMSLADGTTTSMGDSPAGWVPLCAIGAESVLGFTSEGTAYSAAVVGPATVGAVTWDQQDLVAGCSADGQFLYVQRIPQPPTEETEDTEPPNPATALERISLADGTRSEVLTLAPGEIAGPVTR